MRIDHPGHEGHALEIVRRCAGGIPVDARDLAALDHDRSARNDVAAAVHNAVRVNGDRTRAGGRGHGLSVCE